MGWDRLLGTGGLLIRCSLSSSHKMYLAADKKRKGVKVYKSTFEMRNYGNKGSVVGEGWLLLTLDLRCSLGWDGMGKTIGYWWNS